MTTEVKYVPFQGGINAIDSQMTIKDGMLSDCLNVEQVFGAQGYSRIDGFERFDGRAAPSAATYYRLPFTTGTAVINVGDTVTGSTASAKVLAVTLTSGSWVGGDAAGELIIGELTSNWTAASAINVGTQKATATTPAALGSVTETDYRANLLLAQSYRRGLITAITGSGPIRGIGVLNGVVYAIRDIVGGASATLWKSSGSGWTSVRTGLYPGGTYNIKQANFSGASTSLYLFGCNGRGRSWRFDGTTFTFMAPIFSSQATSLTSIAVGTGAKAFTCVEATRSFVSGQTFIVWSTSNAANWMIGTFTSYAANVLTINVTSTGGSGTFTDWEIGLSNFYDKPFDLEPHKDFLFLAYPQGQLQTSNLGDPMTYTTTAALIGCGDDITGLQSMKGGSLGIFCSRKIINLQGSDKTTWQVTNNSLSRGAKFNTVQEVGGNVFSLDLGGISSLQATQNYGDFDASAFSQLVKPLLDRMYATVIGSRIVRSKNQYRIYSSGGDVLTCTVMTGNPVVTPQDVAFSRSGYGVAISVVAEGFISGVESLFFGTSDGYVMQEDKGMNFDGAEIPAVLRLPFSSFRSPSNKKRFRKLMLQTKSSGDVTINFREYFDYSDGTYSRSQTDSADAIGGGGTWNSSNWDQFRWSVPEQGQAEANISGVGRNMGILIWSQSATDSAYALQGLIIHYSVLGLAR